MEYEFYNKGSNKTIKFNTDSKYTFIYGPNGSGKTTFSRTYMNKKINNTLYKVFNEDFINNNVYVTDKDGSKQNSDCKKGLNKLFIGNNVLKYSNFLTKVRQTKNEFLSTNPNILKSNLNEKFILNIDQILEEDEEYKKIKEPFIKTLLTDEYINKKYEQLKNEIDINNIFISPKNILNKRYVKLYELEYKNTYNIDLIKTEILEFLRYQNRNLLKSYNNEINKFHKQMLSSIDNIDNDTIEKMEKYKETLEKESEKFNIIKKIEEKNEKYLSDRIREKDIEIDLLKKWIDDGYTYHKAIDFSNCLYCHNSEFDTALADEYKIKNENEYNITITKMKKFIEEKFKIIFDIINNHKLIKDFYEKVNRKEEQHLVQVLFTELNSIINIMNDIYNTKKFNNNIISEVEKLYEFICKEIKEKIKYEELDSKNEKEFEFSETLKLLYNITDFKRALKKEILCLNIVNLEEKIKQRLQNIQNEEIAKVGDYLQFYQEVFRTKFEINNVKSNISTGQNVDAMLEIKFKNNRKLNEISTGEKNILALIVFFSNIEYEMKQLKENEKITLILDDPVNSNDWNIFFSLQTIIEDYLEFNYKDKLDEIIILSHNVDYAIIQLKNLKIYNNKVKLYRLFDNKCINIDIDLMYTNDINLISQFIYEWISSFEFKNNVYYMDKDRSYRVFITYRKFLEDILINATQISQVNIDNQKSDIEKLKDISNDENMIKLLNYSNNILYNQKDSGITVDDFTKIFIIMLKNIVNANIYIKLENSKFNTLLEKIKISNDCKFLIKGEDKNNIAVSDFKIDNIMDIDQEKMKNILVKSLIIKKASKHEDDSMKFMINKSKDYYINYLKHSNDLVGKPLLALDVEPMLNYIKEQEDS